MTDFATQIRAAQPDDAAGIADLIVRLGTFQHHFEGLSTDAIQQRVGEASGFLPCGRQPYGTHCRDRA